MKVSRLALVALLTAVSAFAADAVDIARVKLGNAIADGRPTVRWRGFNLLEMLVLPDDGKPKEFCEEDFRIIRDWGFNFVRLPLDYRHWIKDGDWNAFNEEHLASVDRAIALGRKYGLHVLLNMHRCPGYTVASPAEKADLFSDPEAQRVCAKHWAMFARRYRGISNVDLSFNLFNEPSKTTDEACGHVVKLLVAAIRKEDPTRFVIADGVGFATKPIRSVGEVPGVGQSLHCYTPMSVSHYLAPWVGTMTVPPVWPLSATAPSGVMGGPQKAAMGMCLPFTLEAVPAGRVIVSYGRCSGPVSLEFLADGKKIKMVTFDPQLGSPAWSYAQKYEAWGSVVQANYVGQDVFDFQEPVGKLVFRVAKGDWIQIREIRLLAPDGKRSAVLTFDTEWGSPRHFTQRFVSWDGISFRSCERGVDTPRYADIGMQYLYSRMFAQWDEPISQGLFAFCGEFGVWKMTPHSIVLDIFEDYLRLLKERNVGWALWELRGGNGVLDSGRDDVDYEDFHGHKLDRKMLELLQRY